MTTIGQARPEGTGQARPPGLGTLSDRVALVTGGTRGIGAAICGQLADAGAEIAAGYWRGHETAEKFVASMTAEYPGRRITVHEGNIGAAGDCRRVLGEVIDQHGRLDVLVNNAGITIDRTVAKMTDEDWQKVIAVNLSGAFFMAQAALEHMLERGTGRIVSVSSVIGETGSIGQANYAASKSGLFGLTKSLAKEAIFQLNRAERPPGDGIGLTVNAVTPGFIATDMLATIPDKVLARIRGQIPVGRLGRPEEIARVVSFLAADESAYITGQIWAVNGGLGHVTGGVMEDHRDVLVLSAVRTAIGKYGGGLAAVPPCDLAATVVREAVSRAGVDPSDVGHAVFGHVIHTEIRDMYLGRVAAVNGGLPVETPAFTLNRLCGSGLQAIVSAAQAIRLGDCDVAVAGGAESMSRGQYWLPGLRWGQRMQDGAAVDAMVGALTDPFDGCHMGVTAENVAADYDVSRADQDALAVESHRRAAAAAEAGYFAEQITPVQVPGRKGTVTVDTDEHVRPGISTDDLAKLRPAFAEGGTVTAGNASGVNDAAAAVVLADREFAEHHGQSALGRLVAYSHAGVEPRIMGMGPVPAVRKVLDRASLKVDDIDLFEVNEAFAAQALAVIRELGLPPERTNPNGSGVSLGHPIAATGTILAVKALYELRRTGGRYALITMCIGGGQGIAAIFERL